MPNPTEAWGPRAHPERCDEFPPLTPHGERRKSYEERILLRLMLTMIGVWGLFAVAGVSAFLLLRWLRVACWLTGCGA